jgi:cytochrome bd ubiquinol oxidase subunit II
MDHSWLPTFWAALIAFTLFVHVVRDGYDLGVGILFGFTRDRTLRDTMVKAISPF